MQSAGESYGKSLPDQVDRISTLFDAHLELISDVRELYRDRASLEKEYATKLQLLTKKALEKKGKLEASVAVGDLPAKAWDANTVTQNSLNAAYTTLTDSMAAIAQDHVTIADRLTSQVVDVLKIVEKKSEDAKKKEMQFFQKLLSDRDRFYADRLKSKQKYDDDCNEVESYRQKQGRAQDDKHADRAAKHAEHQRNEMYNSKNVYLISIALANSTKTQFYDIDLPQVENRFQSLQRRLIERFTKILQHSQNLELEHLDTLKSQASRVHDAFGRVDITRDQNIFIDHNLRPFTAPQDWLFEPCSTHYDTGEINLDPTPKTVLQNKLNRCRSKLEELAPLKNAKRREQDQLQSKVSSYTANHIVGDIDELTDASSTIVEPKMNFLDVQHQLMLYTTAENILQAEIGLISTAIGDDEGVQLPHSFKSSIFSMPTQCAYCKTSIWGLSKQGKTCKLCGISVHSKCELKVPADCKRGSSQSTIHRKGTSLPRTSSRASATQLPTTSTSVKSAGPEDSSEESYPTARVLFNFTPTSEFELGVAEGATVYVVEPDDGSGWVKVSDARGGDGLVPASYLKHDDSITLAGQESAGQESSGEYVRVIYPYEARGQDEMSLAAGQTIQLTSGPSGGQHYGNGWWEGLDVAGNKKIFPGNYVEMV